MALTTSSAEPDDVAHCLNATLRAPVGLDDVFDCPPADGAARVGHLLEFETTGVAETHVSTGVEDRVHHILIADGAFVAP